MILAAGKGTRLGGPKGALLWKGELLLALHARAMASVAGEVVLAISPEVGRAIGRMDVLRAELLAQATKLHLVEVTTSGPYETLLAAARELPSQDALWITHVDSVPPPLELLGRMLEHYVSKRPVAIKPVLFGAEKRRGGHPVLVRRNLIDARFEHLRACLQSVEVDSVETEDRRILSTINTHKECEEWLGHPPAFFSFGPQ